MLRVALEAGIDDAGDAAMRFEKPRDLQGGG